MAIAAAFISNSPTPLLFAGKSKTLSYCKRQSAEFFVVQEKFLDAASEASLTKKISMWQSISYK